MAVKSASPATLQTAKCVFTGMNSIEKIGEQARNFGQSALIVCDSGISETGLVERVKGILEEAGVKVGVFDEVEPEPAFELVYKCADEAKKGKFESLVGLGGGSSMDVAKGAAVAVTHDGDVSECLGIGLVRQRPLPTILVPTTSGTGSEATKYAIFTYNNMKQGIIDPKIYADVAIVDPSLTISMPPKTTAASGMDALCHVIECYTALSATPISDMVAKEGLRLIAGSIRKAVFNGNDIDARSDMSLGSFYGGLCLTNASVTAVHALSFPLGVDYHIPHGISNAVMLPYVMRYNCLSKMERFREVAAALGERTDRLSVREGAMAAADAVETLMKDIGLPVHLRDLGISKDAIPSLAERALGVQRLLTMNPRFMGLDDIIRVYEEAF